MTLLQEIVAALVVPRLAGEVDLSAVVSAVALDSRNVEAGALFVSMAEGASARAAHIAEARAAGAIAVIGPPGSDADIVVADAAVAAATAAGVFYRHPSRELAVVGITGTNGKSSITHSLGGVLRTLGMRVGEIGTIGITLDGAPLDHQRRTPTTPESMDLQALLRGFVDAGATHAVMEASSIALAEHRLDGTDLAVGCFTNLTHDHLDAHGSFAAYEAAKLHMFDLARIPVANVDDPVGRRISQRWDNAHTFALHRAADVRATQLQRKSNATRFLVQAQGRSVDASVQGFGELTVSNALAVLTSALALGAPLEDAVRALAAQPGPPGRMEVIPVDRPYTVMIDYAHSPDAMDQVLRTLRTGAPGRVITVFGCGGDRDRAKRPVMGRIAAELSDQVIITTDNPRTEDADQIIAEIVAGTGAHSDWIQMIPDRTQAIGAALQLGRPGDLVLIAGKGSETYQIIGEAKVPYSDQATVRMLAES